MEVIGIFGTKEDILCSVQWHDPDSGIPSGEAPDALSQITDDWNDPVFLRSFFKQYEKDYNTLGRPEPLKKAPISARKEGNKLLQQLDDLAKNHNTKGLENLFNPLADDDKDEDPSRIKAYGGEYKSYMRIYAVKHKNVFYITGGAIKLTQKMQGRPHTETELYKMNVMREFLEGDVELLEYYFEPKQ